MQPPRIRGKVGQAESPDDVKGKYFFEISIWDLAGENQVGDPLGPFGPFDTEKVAKEEMRKAVKMCCDIYLDKVGLPQDASRGYVDMKNEGKFRKWEES